MSKRDPITNRAAVSPQPGGKGAENPFTALWSGLADLAETIAAFSRRLTAIETRPAAKDGTGIRSAVISRDGGLALILTDGSTVEVGRVAGKDCDIDADAIESLIASRIADAVAALPEPPPTDLTALTARIDEAFAALASFRQPADGKSVTLDDVAPMIHAEIERALAPAEPVPAEPDMDAIGRMITERVRAAVADLPPPKDGKNAEPVDLDAIASDAAERAAAMIHRPADGVSVVDCLVNADGHLMTVLSDNRRLDAGKVVADAPEPVLGPAGRSIESAAINEDGELLITMSDGDVLNAGHVVGADGDPGRGVAQMKREGDNLVAVLTDGEAIDLGRIKGAAGKPGAPGKPGKSVKGDAGATVHLVNFTPADLSASEIERLQFADLLLDDGTSIRVLTQG